MGKLKVYVVEDEMWVRRGILFRLASIGDVAEVVGESGSYEEAARALEHLDGVRRIQFLCVSSSSLAVFARYVHLVLSRFAEHLPLIKFRHIPNYHLLSNWIPELPPFSFRLPC